MKKYGLLQLVFLFSFFSAQDLKFQTLLKDQISIRAIQIWGGKVYYSGTDSKFGYVSIQDPLDQKQIKLSEEKWQFRTLSQNKTHFYTINIESPAHFFEIEKKSLKVRQVHVDGSKNAFYDALHFHQGYFYTFSDPENDLNLKFVKFSVEKGLFSSRDYSQEKLMPGEAAFAASNTNIASSTGYVWLATGGMFSRILRLNLKNQRIEIFNTPFIQGSSSQGIYSIDFYNNTFGVAVGGDYTQQKANVNNIATTHDGGKTWEIQASGKNAGYKTCVKLRPGHQGKDMIALGDQNIEFSGDYGQTWKKISDEKNLYVCEWVDENTLILAGKDKILKTSISDILKK